MIIKSIKALKYFFVTLFVVTTAFSQAQLVEELTCATAFEDHAIYIHETALINFGNLFPYSSYPAAEQTAVQGRLSTSDVEIGSFFGGLLGTSVGNQISSFFAVYDTFALQLITAIKANNQNQIQQIYSQWLAYGGAIAAFLHSVNPLIDSGTAHNFFNQLVQFDAEQIIFYWTQDYASALVAYDQSRNIANQAGAYFGLACWQFIHR